MRLSRLLKPLASSSAVTTSASRFVLDDEVAGERVSRVLQTVLELDEPGVCLEQLRLNGLELCGPGRETPKRICTEP